MPFADTSLVADLTWWQVEQRLAAGAAAVLPIGAGAKQHGLHLPMATDRIQAEWFASRIAAMIDALVWPTVTYGFYPAFEAYAGSLSLSEATFEQSILEIVADLDRFGARTILVLDTGLSTVPVVGRALARMPSRNARVKHLKLHSGPRYRLATLEYSQQSHGSHADELETSIMLALDAANVDMTLAEDSPPLAHGVQAGVLTPIDPTSPNFSPSGSFGQPTLATAEKGRALIEAIVADLAADLQNIFKD